MTRRPTVRHATVAALTLHVVLGTISTLLFVAAFQFRTDWFMDPAAIADGGTASAALLRWGAVTDLFSYYLPIAVVAIVLWMALHRRHELVAMVGLVGALGYALLGGAGASILALAAAPLIEAIAEPTAAAADPATSRAALAVLVDVVFRAIWQFIDAILLAAWFGSVAVLLADARPGLARLSFVLAMVSAIGAALNLLGLGLARDALLGVLFVLWAAWSVWLAALVWRRAEPFGVLDPPRARP